MNPGVASAGAASNQYQILGHLATGGMAELYLARAVGIAGFERYVVLKRIMAEHSRNHRFITMFLDEARLAAQLHHPNIAQVYDIGRVSDSYFFTLEYVHGENCRDVLQRVAGLKRQIPIEQTLAVIAGAAAGLHYAHEKHGLDRQPLGIVHRDVSPSNLMVSYEGAIKLVDFGIAKAAHRMTETRSGAVKGKVAYMSPEQCTGHPLDRRSDIFSLGIVFYEMATMTRLFKHPNDFETMTRIVNGPIPPPTSRRPELSRQLEAVILTCLARRPEDRYQTGADLLQAIDALAAHERLSLSAPALGRYLRELFGERPEPWDELEAAGEHTGLVTIETTSSGLDPAGDALSAGSTQRSWSAGGGGGRDWLPGSSAALVSAVSVLTSGATPPTIDLPAESPAYPSSPPAVPVRLVPAPLLTAAPPIRSGARLPLQPPAMDAAEGSDPDGAATVVGPASGPLIMPPPLMVRDTPDRDPSWGGGGDRDPSWGGGSGAAEIDLRPRHRWVLWSALATVAIGVIAIVVASGGNPESGSPAAVPASAAPPAAVADRPPPATVADSAPPVAAPPPPAAAVADPPATAATRTVGSTKTRPRTLKAKPDRIRPGDGSSADRATKPPKPPVKCGGLYPPCD